MDAAIMDFVQANLHSPAADAICIFLTRLGAAGFIWICIALALFLIPKYRRVGVMVACGLIVTFLIGEVLIKNVVMRPRPFMDFPDVPLLIPPLKSYSFPSGHAGSSFAAATMLWIADRRFGTAALVLAAGIAFSRVLLFMHYPSDILAGALLGAACSSLLYFLFFRRRGGAFPPVRKGADSK